jgi:hypothetical protein
LVRRYGAGSIGGRPSLPCVFVCVYVCVCVCERARERELGSVVWSERVRERDNLVPWHGVCVCVAWSVCVRERTWLSGMECVCVRERELGSAVWRRLR